MSGIRTTCPYCGVGCGVIVANGAVAGDRDHPANFGRLCSKGAALAETLDDSRRLLRPRVDGQDVEWDAALSLIATRFRDTIAEHGPDAVAFYVSGQLSTEDYYVANKLMKGFIGSANIDTNSRLCMASSVAGHVRAFGEDIVPGTYEDWEKADLVVLVGSNTAWCHPVLYQRLMAARAARGTRIVVIDPRRTATCENADLHLAIAPGTDVALFAGLLVHLADRDACDRAWIDAHTNGLDEALAAARGFAATPVRVAEITGVASAAVTAFYELFARTERVLTVYSQGVNQSSAGTDKVNAIINCHLATARIGREGMGPFSVTGQPNAMGGREVGGLANQLAAHMGFDRANDVDRVRRFWKAPNIATRPGLKAVDLFDAVLDGQVKALWIAATNPAASMPRAEHVRRALKACPFVTVADCWPTDTTQFADVILPAAGWGEKTATVTNSERRISRQRPFRLAPGESKPDWWMFTQLARRMGWTEAFAYDTAEQIFDEHAALSAFENEGMRGFDIGALVGMTDARLPAQWPTPARGEPQGGRFFADGRFFTSDGRARFVPTPFRPVAAKTDRRNPFLLNTGRVRDQWHTMTRTGHVPRLMAHQEEPFLELHPRDAMKLSLADGDLVRVETAHASTILRTRANAGLRPGEVFAPMHWTDDFVSSGPVARLVDGVCDPISGQPELKATSARLAPMPTLWRGVLFGGTRPRGKGFYCARVPLARGTVHELVGWEPLPAGLCVPVWLDQFLEDALGGDRIEEIDEERGIYRAAHVVGGRLRSFLFAARDRSWQMPERDAVVPLIGTLFDAAVRTTVFELRRAPANRGRREGAVCSCFAVGRASIEQAILAGRLTRADQVGKAVRAGTNCGSCIPEIEGILHAVHAND